MFQRLFEPIKIGRLTVKNRIEAAPAHPSLATADGQITRELIDYYSAKARGGAGIVTVGGKCRGPGTCHHSRGTIRSGQG